MAVGSRPLVPSRLAPGGALQRAHGSRRTPRTVIGAYIALTKPRIIELLLITTVPTMVLAERGWPNLGARAADARRRHPGRRWRQRHQHVRRPRHRRQDAADPGSSARHRRHPAAPRAGVRAGPRGRRLRRAVVGRQPAVRPARRGGGRVLRRRVHAVAEAHQPPQHRDRRGGRCGAGPRRLGRRHGLARLGRR